MKKIRNYFIRHPISTYFFLTFLISWGGVFFISGGLSGFPEDKREMQSIIMGFIAAVLGGPSISGLLMTGLVYGKSGYRELFSRLFVWKLQLKWYLIAIFLGALVLYGILALLSLFSPVYLPGILTVEDWGSRLSMGLISAVMVGILEETGWTGFATPLLRKRFSVLKAGVILGSIWGGWHILLNVIWPGAAYAGDVPSGIFIAARGLSDLIGVLPAFRVLMVWVYDRTKSLMLAMIMHFSLTAGTIIFEPEAISGTSLLVYDAVSLAVMWGVTALVIFTGSRRNQFTYK